jgi:mitochondrial ribosomal protein L44
LFYFRNYNSELYAFSKRLNEDFDLDKLKIAFTHDSYLKEEEKRQKELNVPNVSIDLHSNQELAEEGHFYIRSFSHLYLRHFLPRVPEECIR